MKFFIKFKSAIISLLYTSMFFICVNGQNLTISTYSNQSEIVTYNNGSITLENGFNTNGKEVRIFISDGLPPVSGPVVPKLSNNVNYVATWIMSAPLDKTSELPVKPVSEVRLSTQYLDGLGRLLQTVRKQGSLDTKSGFSADLVESIRYDGIGRETDKYLPYVTVSNDGSYKGNSIASQQLWYKSSASPVLEQDESGVYAYSTTRYEESSLNRIQKKLAPGDNWIGSNRGEQSTFDVNTSVDSVVVWDIAVNSIVGGGLVSPSSSGFYTPGQLSKIITQDAEGRQLIEFKTKEGQLVLKKRQTFSSPDIGNGRGYYGWVCSYYIYDNLNNLRCVVQPEGVKLLEANNWMFTSSILKEQCFRYEYDGRNRLIIKQSPGIGTVYLVYDSKDRMIMKQDSVMRTTNKWLVTHYDDLNRADSTWLYTLTSGFVSILEAAAGSSEYPSIVPSASTILTERHFDNYNNVAIPNGMSATYKSDWDTCFEQTSATTFPYPEMPRKNSDITTKGLETWSRVQVLDSSLKLTCIKIYDDKGRVIQTQSQNITGGVDVTTTQYTWAGWPLIIVQKQEEKKGGAFQITVVVTKMSYDDLGRVVQVEMRQSNSNIAGGRMTDYAIISRAGYDALGQVKEKKIGKRRSSSTAYTTVPLETQNYDYNIRGWLLGVNRDYIKDLRTTSTSSTATNASVISGEAFTESSMDAQAVGFPTKSFFGFDLGYDKKDNKRINNIPYDSARYNGNITGMTWKCDNDKKIRKYDYSYDPLNRLTEARFGQFDGNAFSNNLVNYDVNNLTYDDNGNVITMNQFGLKTTGGSDVIDKLTYRYVTGTNKLKSVADAVNDFNSILGDFKYTSNIIKTQSTIDYTYDANGNLKSDNNKKVTNVTYNILNLPSVITIDQKGAIKYYYDALGNKLQKRTTDITSSLNTIVTNYIGEAVYQNDTLKFFGTVDGVVRANEAKTGWIYDYFLKDHLGNTRMLITDDYNVASAIIESNSYYPFGLLQKEISLSIPDIKFKNNRLFNGKELQVNEFADGSGLDVYDYGVRFYDPQVARWYSADPLGDSMRRYSLYSYAYDNPIRFIDPDGMAPSDPPGLSQYFSNFFRGQIRGFQIKPGNNIPSIDQVVFDRIIYSLIQKGIPINKAFKEASDIISGFIPFKSSYDEIKKGNYLAAAAFGAADLLGAELTKGVGKAAASGLSRLLEKEAVEFSEVLAVKTGTEGGLNLFKFGKPTTSSAEGWRTGDRMLKMFDQGAPKLNWKQNSGFLRREMRLGNPIFDSYRYPNGVQIPTRGFLNAERKLLESRGWIYNPSTGAYHL